MHRRVVHLVLWLLVLAFAVGGSTYSILRHMDRQSAILDLGIQTQVVWNTAQGRPFESSIEVRNYLADHLSLILALLAPLYWVWPDVRLLLAFQALVLALGAYPVYRLAREETADERVGLFFALLYLLYPALGFVVRFDFHAEALVVPLLLAGLWSWRARRTGLAVLAFLLALLCREETGLVIAALGLVLALRSKGSERRLAWQLGAIGLAWSLLGMGLVMPYLRGQQSDTFLACFQQLGPSYGQALLRVVSDPLGALRDSWSGLVFYKATFAPRLLLPLAFLPLLAPSLLLPLLPALAPGLFSRCLPHSTIYYQYTAPLIPFLFWAAIAGFRRADTWLGGLLAHDARGHAVGSSAGSLREGPIPAEGRGDAPSAAPSAPARIAVRVGLMLLVLLGTAGALAWDFPWWKPVQGSGLYYVGRPEPPANQAAFHEAASLIPADAALATDNLLGPQFAHRRFFYFFPYWEAWRADYLLVDLQSTPPAADERTRVLRLLLGCPLPALAGQAEPFDPLCRGAPGQFAWASYGVRYWRDGVLLLQRGYAADPAVQEEVVREVEGR